jgi:hypothetical protein
MAGTDFPLFNVLLTLFWFAVLLIWVVTVVAILTDVLRSHDLTGGAKASWFLFVVLLPFAGAFVYLVDRGGSMHERAAASLDARQRAYRRLVTDRMGGPSAADELRTLGELHDSGVPTDAEYAAQRRKLAP